MREILNNFDPAILKELYAKSQPRSWNARKKPRTEYSFMFRLATDELPAKVAAFWNAPEP
jgi:hypothetical protein